MSAARTLQALAITKSEKVEGFTPEQVVDAVECIMRDADLANAYIALSKPDHGAAKSKGTNCSEVVDVVE